MIGWTGIARAALLACLFSSAALAESGGTITGTIDGERVSWQLEASQSDWNAYGVSFRGKNPEGSTAFHTIMIGFSKNGNRFELPEVGLYPQAPDSSAYGGEDQGVAVNVTRWEVDGDTLSLTGAIGGPVYVVVNPVGMVIDQNNGHELNWT